MTILLFPRNGHKKTSKRKNFTCKDQLWQSFLGTITHTQTHKHKLRAKNGQLNMIRKTHTQPQVQKVEIWVIKVFSYLQQQSSSVISVVLASARNRKSKRIDESLNSCVCVHNTRRECIGAQNTHRIDYHHVICFVYICSIQMRFWVIIVWYYWIRK